MADRAGQGTPTETRKARLPAVLVGYVGVSTTDERRRTVPQRDALRAPRPGVDERHVGEDKASGGRGGCERRAGRAARAWRAPFRVAAIDTA